MTAIFGANPILKHAVIVNMHIDVCDAEEVEWAIATRFQVYEDLVMGPNARGSTLDSSADQDKGLTKLGIDATRPLNKPKEKSEREEIPRKLEEKIIIETRI